MYYSSQRLGLHQPPGVRGSRRAPDRPGETRTCGSAWPRAPAYDLEADSGWVAWRGANGTRARIPVVLAN